MMCPTSDQLVFLSICRSKITAVFGDHRVTSDAGVLVLREVDQRIGLIDALTDAMVGCRHAFYVRHDVSEMAAQTVFQIALGYEDANDCDTLKGDPVLNIAGERHPLDGADLASQPQSDGGAESRAPSSVRGRLAMRRQWARNIRAVRSHVKLATLLLPRSTSVLQSASSVQRRKMASAISSGPPGPKISARAPEVAGTHPLPPRPSGREDLTDG